MVIDRYLYLAKKFVKDNIEIGGEDEEDNEDGPTRTESISQIGKKRTSTIDLTSAKTARLISKKRG